MIQQLRNAIREELDFSATSEYAVELIEAGTSIYKIDPVNIAYDLTECDWPYTAGIDYPFSAADLIPYIAAWQRDRS